jgi:hypothetical protein
MKTNAPKFVTWLIGLIIAALGLLGHLVTIPVLSDFSFWLVLIAAALLLLASAVKGL